VVVVVVPASPLVQLSLIWNSRRKNVVVGCMAGRAGAMRAIAPSMPPHFCPWQGRRRLKLRLYDAGEVIDFARVAVCGFKMVLFAPGRAAGGPRRGFVPQVQAA
jgi:hypothetical protein